ncbi:MAG: DUF6390 family protein [Patescibacteria group bacterium]
MIPSLSNTLTVDGVSRCARYSFGPNRLHLCGPDANREVLAYLTAHESDDGLSYLLKKFKTLYPYLETIAHANKIKDPFDARVVEAYWLGNELLDSIDVSTFYRHLTDSLHLKKRLKPPDFKLLTDKLSAFIRVTIRDYPRRLGARMHHNFHVFNVWQRTGHAEKEHTLESMDKCRVSWGTVTLIDGPFITVMRQPLTFANGHPRLDLGSKIQKNSNDCLALGSPVSYRITRRLDDNSFMEDVKAGDTISIHWDMPCEILTPRELNNLKYYTRLALSCMTI